MLSNKKSGEKYHIIFFELEDWQVDYVKSQLKGSKLSLRFVKDPLSPVTASQVKDAELISGFIYSKYSKQVLDRLPKLKLIATMSTGYDHIDMNACNARNITVCNVPLYGENTVAEHTFALILAMSRKIYPSIERTKKADFNLSGLRGFDLKGKSIGLIGTGHIAAHVARIAYGFEMKILGYDLHPNADLKRLYGMRYADLKDLLKQSDIISLHLPLNEHTKHIIDKKNISLMKSSAIIVNTARGGLIETDALVTALKNHKIAGAALDVLEEENFVKEDTAVLSKEYAKQFDIHTVLENHMMLKLDNVIITPHNAFNSEEALKRILDTTIDNIKRFIDSKPENVVKSL